jgi:hypothetical protein
MGALAGAPGPETDLEVIEAAPNIVNTPRPLPSKTIRSTSSTSPTDSLEIPSTQAPRVVLDPSARLLLGDSASETWTLYVELESGHRITQRFLISNAGPGVHNAVAIGHFVEPGRAPYRYQNGRRRARWRLSKDRLFLDIAASHLDLHRPKGELRITKDDIEIRLFFDFPEQAASARVPAAQLPPEYNIDVLAVGAATQGSIKAPWMAAPLETRGHLWLVHTWTNEDEAHLLNRRVEVFGQDHNLSFYGIQMRDRGDWESAWNVLATSSDRIIESGINIPTSWMEDPPGATGGGSKDYPTPRGFHIRQPTLTGAISLGSNWLQFDPLEVLPQPFRWFVRRKSKPLEVWASAEIGVTLLSTPDSPSLPQSGTTLSAEARDPRVHETAMAGRSKREIEDETAERSVTGVASITFLNPTGRR